MTLDWRLLILNKEIANQLAEVRIILERSNYKIARLKHSKTIQEDVIQKLEVNEKYRAQQKAEEPPNNTLKIRLTPHPPQSPPHNQSVHENHRPQDSQTQLRSLPHMPPAQTQHMYYGQQFPAHHYGQQFPAHKTYVTTFHIQPPPPPPIHGPFYPGQNLR